ncbi:hypothetical protein SU48_01975 [Deinococcus puniceus]|uniref:DUF11 domain-containing protein n=1 Tax=Deinococcus puniceus TaxID=1182568 RepID=A0A172TCM7_9DEIO|nr:hypothetical protein SU48_01975 [Deinococcus puniceus]
MAALALALSSSAFAAGTPAGTVIQNQAFLEFSPNPGQPPLVIPSLPVETTVLPVCSVSVLPNGTLAAPGQSYSLLPGEGAVLRYVIANTGNTSNTLGLQVVTDAASQFTPGDLSLHIDANGNGIIDANEPAATQITLAADQTADVLVQVTTTSAARGNAFLNLIGSCATNITGTAGERDDNNVARVTVGEPPTLTVTKSFSPPSLNPGQETTVTVTARNTGAGASREVLITDMINTTAMKDFTFIGGSARLLDAQGAALGKVEYTPDGTAWQAAESMPVAGLRGRISSLAPNASAVLTFRLRAPLTEVGTRRNIATLISGDQTVEAPADVTVKYNPEIALGPVGNPRALTGGEGSANDRQVKDVAVLGQEVCFVQTVQNLGDRADTLTITGRLLIGEATFRFTQVGGAPIAEPFQIPALAPQATQDFRVCVTPSKAGAGAEALRLELTAKSSMGAADNLTIDSILTLVDNALKPVKSVDVGDMKLVKPGQDLSYTLTFTNAQSFALTNVVVRDNLNVIQVLDAAGKLTRTDTLEFVSADNGGVLESTEAVWRFPSVAAGQTLTLNLKTRVPATSPDGSSVVNVFTVASSEIPAPVPSNPITNPVFDPANLTLVKSSTPALVSFGQEITYTFTVTNKSAAANLTLIEVVDNLPTGLVYVEGSSTLDGAAITPTVSGRTYTWQIPGLAAGQVAEVRFRALVTPEAGTEIRNSAVATAISPGGVPTAPTPPSSTVTKITPESIFGRNTADIVGYVFLDRNRDGIYNKGSDVPHPNARVILANGRIALTDVEGRYRFGNVMEGTVAVRLDPNSVIPQNLSIPQDAGLSGSRLVYVRNLTSIDFPLAPDGGDIAVIRDTTLRVKGGLPEAQNSFMVRKQVFTTEEAGVYRVQLILSASANLPAFSLTDPLPADAALLDGQNVLNFDTLPSGERAVTYRFRWAGDSKGAVTDPTASWRY